MTFNDVNGQRALDALERIAVAVEEIAGIQTKPIEGVVLSAVPWLSQMGPTANFAPGDCGPACTAMWLRYYGENVTVDQLSKETGLPAGYNYTYPAHLMNIMRAHGHETYWRGHLTRRQLYDEIDTGHPCIVLVEYDHLPADVRYDQRYRYGHWLLVVGYGVDADLGPVVVYHDPYFLDTTGAFVTIQADAFSKAWGMNHESGNRDFQAIRLRR